MGKILCVISNGTFDIPYIQTVADTTSTIALKLTHWSRVTHICVSKLTISQIMACRLVGTKPLSKPIMVYCYLNWTPGSGIQWNLMHFHSRKSILKCRLGNGVHFDSASMCEIALEYHSSSKHSQFRDINLFVNCTLENKLRYKYFHSWTQVVCEDAVCKMSAI